MRFQKVIQVYRGVGGRVFTNQILGGLKVYKITYQIVVLRFPIYWLPTHMLIASYAPVVSGILIWKEVGFSG
jgi:hypothetical protein